jgi:hypothetical protein
MRRLVAAWGIAVLFALSQAAWAHGDEAHAPGAPKVKSVRRHAPHLSSGSEERKVVDLGDSLEVFVSVDDPAKLLGASGKDVPRVWPVINGVTLTGVVPERAWKVADDEVGLSFKMEYRRETQPAWAALARKMLLDTDVKSIALCGESPAPEVAGKTLAPGDLRIRILQPAQAWLFVGLVVAALVVFAVLANRTAIVRDRPTIDGSKGAYSLGRVQMAWWFFLVLGAWSYVHLVTGGLDTIPESILGLTGISAGTAFGAVVMDGGPKTDAAAVKESATSDNFLIDLIGGKGNAGIHRFQLVVWTVALGLVFAWTTMWTLSMPDFGGALLGMMGFSSAAYIGLKSKEGQPT